MSVDRKLRVGLIGVGLMGHGIASNILKHGYALTFLDHPGNRPTGDLQANGACVASTPEDVAKVVDVVILCVTGTPQVEDVFHQTHGLMQGFHDGLIVIDCSTAIPVSTMKLARAVKSAHGYMIDAAMTRTPREAEAGRLNLIVGGERAIIEKCRPILECYAENITIAGPVGSGQRLKLVHNFVSLGFAVVLAEAAAYAKRCSMDTKTFLSVLGSGGAGGVTLQRMEPYIKSGDKSAFQFSVRNALKDLSYYVAMAQGDGAASTTASALVEVCREGSEARAAATVPELVDILASLGDGASAPDEVPG